MTYFKVNNDEVIMQEVFFTIWLMAAILLYSFCVFALVHLHLHHWDVNIRFFYLLASVRAI